MDAFVSKAMFSVLCHSFFLFLFLFPFSFHFSHIWFSWDLRPILQQFQNPEICCILFAVTKGWLNFGRHDEAEIMRIIELHRWNRQKRKKKTGSANSAEARDMCSLFYGLKRPVVGFETEIVILWFF